MTTRRIPGGSVTGTTDFEPSSPMPDRRIPAPTVQLGEVDDQPRPERRTGSATFGQPEVEHRLRLDPELGHHVEKLLAAADAAGYQRGVDDGRREAHARLDGLAQSVALSVSAIEDHMERTRQGTIGGVLDLARAIARQVIGRTPHDEGAALLARIDEVLDLLDERPLTIFVSPDDAEVVGRVAEAHPDLHVETDGRLQPGEAAIQGGWSHADLTYEAAWTSIERQLGAE